MAVKYKVELLPINPVKYMTIKGEELLRRLVVGHINRGNTEIPWTHVILRNDDFSLEVVRVAEEYSTAHILVIGCARSISKALIWDLVLEALNEARDVIGERFNTDTVWIDDRFPWEPNKKALLMRAESEWELSRLVVA